MQVTLEVGAPPIVDRDRADLQRALNYLESLQAGSRVYLILDVFGEIAIELLWKGDMHLWSAFALIECQDYQSAVARLCKEKIQPYSGKCLQPQLIPQGGPICTGQWNSWRDQNLYR